jgi:hypothetical protein
MKESQFDICANCLHLNDDIEMFNGAVTVTRHIVYAEDEIYNCSIHEKPKSVTDKCKYITNISELSAPVRINIHHR